MPIDPKDLLDLAKRLVGTQSGANEADLRRGISTAYYALFQLLIKEAMTSFVSDPGLRTRVDRAFDHGPMKKVCEKYNPDRPDKNTKQYVTAEGKGFPSVVIANAVREVAAAFIKLNEAREEADYDDAATVQHTDALANVEQVEQAFRSWLTVQNDYSAIMFLQELLCRSILKR